MSRLESNHKRCRSGRIKFCESESNYRVSCSAIFFDLKRTRALCFEQLDRTCASA
jgi:hypothetical protein